ncbi:hypothetical protein [Nocardia bovistercoris]|uniref:Uncharacterized protein n=1 Tax=Nocardia bovistercoris TaxID=2785916 RepID=A0A931IDL1_9NOCA|nr:hypothetical protein [Nocardia bovistercoris]MBH0779499.1 hypothetical protein [Nocardia bovistercoris]
MSTGPCPDIADVMTRELGGFDCGGSPFVEFRNPADLSNWTLPVVEALMIAGSVYALWWAVRRLRRDGDPTNLALWFGAMVYLLVMEPPLYLPNKFGMMDRTGLNFVHNVFTVDIFYDRMPLYIVALYGAVPMLAYETTRALGVFRRFGLLAGALSVGMTHSAFYEIFDHIGPQLRWWAWNADAPSNSVFFDSVPLGSVTLFSAIGPAILAYLVARYVGRPTWAGQAPRGWSLTLRTIGIGVAVPILIVVVGALISIQQAIGGGDTGTAVLLTIELAGIWLAGGYFLVRAWLAGRAAGDLEPSPAVRNFGWIYLATFAILWATALPDLFDAEGGITSDNTPTGNIAFTILCFVVAAAATWAGGSGVRQPSEEPRAMSPAS